MQCRKKGEVGGREERKGIKEREKVVDRLRLQHRYPYFSINIQCIITIQNVNRKTPVFSVFGGKFYLVEVIAFVLGHLKSLFLQENDIKSLDMNLANVHWVITVPAIWNPEGKQMMREAAYLVRYECMHNYSSMHALHAA